jgi:hypothetical protein
MDLRLFPSQGQLEDILPYELFVGDPEVLTKGPVTNEIDPPRVLVINRTGDVVDERLKNVRRFGKDLYERFQCKLSDSTESFIAAIWFLSQKDRSGL